MYVKLNFESGLSLKRTYTIQEQITEQSVIEADGLEVPLTIQEYKARIKDLKLDIGEFCFYQDRILAYTCQNLNEIFEKLSGSLEFKENYEELLQ